jgi:hypothetical protein
MDQPNILNTFRFVVLLKTITHNRGMSVCELQTICFQLGSISYQFKKSSNFNSYFHNEPEIKLSFVLFHFKVQVSGPERRILNSCAIALFIFLCIQSKHQLFSL